MSASATGSHRLSIAFDSQPELTGPLTVIHRPHNPNGPHEATVRVPALVVEATPTPYRHWGINE